MKKTFIHGLLAGLLASFAGIGYNYMYCHMLSVDFSQLVNPKALMISCVLGTMLAAFGHHTFEIVVKKNADVWFNLIFILLSFLSFLGPLRAHLAADITNPTLFLGLTEPLHMFPIVFWLATKPLFDAK